MVEAMLRTCPVRSLVKARCGRPEAGALWEQKLLCAIRHDVRSLFAQRPAEMIPRHLLSADYGRPKLGTRRSFVFPSRGTDDTSSESSGSPQDVSVLEIARRSTDWGSGPDMSAEGSDFDTMAPCFRFGGFARKPRRKVPMVSGPPSSALRKPKAEKRRVQIRASGPMLGRSSRLTGLRAGHKRPSPCGDPWSAPGTHPRLAGHSKDAGAGAPIRGALPRTTTQPQKPKRQRARRPRRTTQPCTTLHVTLRYMSDLVIHNPAVRYM